MSVRSTNRDGDGALANTPPQSHVAHHMDTEALFAQVKNMFTWIFRKETPALNVEDDDDVTVDYDDDDDEWRYDLPDAEAHGDDTIVFHENMYENLYSECEGLRRRVAVQGAEMKAFEGVVATSRKHRKESLIKIKQRVSLIEDGFGLPEDTFSFFVITQCDIRCKSQRRPEKSFWIALLVFLLQIFTLILLALDVIDIENSDNPLGIPAGVDWTVQASQLIALLITVISQNEVSLSLNVLFDGYNEAALNRALIEVDGIGEEVGTVFCRRKWWASACLRLVTGLLALGVTFMLIMRADSVRELLLNFTAVEFISNVDDTMFTLSKWGYFGYKVQRDAEIIANTKWNSKTSGVLLCSTPENATVEDLETPVTRRDEGAESHSSSIGSNATGSSAMSGAETSSPRRVSPRPRRCRCSRRALILLLIWLSMLVPWALISVWQGDGRYLPNALYVQFGDEFFPALATFSGLYSLDKNGSLWGRKKYVSQGYGHFADKSAVFQYCANLRAWTFSYGDKPKLLDDQCTTNMSHFIRAQSSESTSFDVMDTVSDTWYYRSNQTERLLALRQFSMRQTSSSRDCAGHGSLQEGGMCDCENNWFGFNCHFGKACETVQLLNKDQPFNSTRIWSEEYQILRREGDVPVRVYDRPVLFGGTTNQGNTDLMFFTGRRWVLTHSGRFPSITGIPRNKTFPEARIVDFFEKGFHGFWSQYEVSFISEAVDVDSPNEGATPEGLQWFSARASSSKSAKGIQVPDVNRKSDTILLCRCDKDLNSPHACLHEGMCGEDGTCMCKDGSSGSRCEITPTGNGVCNRLFNTGNHEFDGGDCCLSTCDAEECGTVENVFVGFPYCSDSSQQGNGICDLALNTADHDYDSGDCCMETCGDETEKPCGTISDSVFGGPYKGFMHCRNPDTDHCKNTTGGCLDMASVTFELDLGSNPEDVEFHLVCGDITYGDTKPGAFKETVGRRRGTLVVPDKVHCELNATGSVTDAYYLIFYGDSATNEEMLIERRYLAEMEDRNIAFTASPPATVLMAIDTLSDETMDRVRLGLLCSTTRLEVMEDHTDLELAFDDSNKAFQEVTVRQDSSCEFDGSGKMEFDLAIGEGSDKYLLYQGVKAFIGASAKVFFRASSLGNIEMVPVVALVELSQYYDETEIILRCDTIMYSSKELKLRDSKVLHDVFLVPKGEMCVLVIMAPSDGNFTLYYEKVEESSEIVVKETTPGICERVYFKAEEPSKDVFPMTMRYELLNVPGSMNSDLKCGDALSFPSDNIDGEARATILVPKGVHCTFTVEKGGDSDSPCERGEGFYRIYYGPDAMSTDDLVSRGSLIEDETESFLVSSSSVNSFFVEIISEGDVDENTQLLVRCDNALKSDASWTNGPDRSETRKALTVREGASCEFIFTGNEDSYRVLHADENNSSEITLFEGGSGNGGSTVFFGAFSRFFHLVPVIVHLDLSALVEGHPDDIDLRLSCQEAFETYFRISNAGRSTSHTFQVPEGAACKVLIVNVDNPLCCGNGPGSYMVLDGSTSNTTDVLTYGDFTCRSRGNFTAPTRMPLDP